MSDSESSGDQSDPLQVLDSLLAQLSDTPNDPSIHLSLAQLYSTHTGLPPPLDPREPWDDEADLHHPGNALYHVTESISLDPENYDAHFLRGSLLLNNMSGDFGKANFTRCVELRPDAIVCYCKRSLSSTKPQQSDVDAARIDVVKAKELLGDTWEQSADLAVAEAFIEAETSNHEAALQHFARVRELDPTNVFGNFGVAIVEMKRGGPPEAAKSLPWLLKTLDVDPFFADAWVLHGVVTTTVTAMKEGMKGGPPDEGLLIESMQPYVARAPKLARGIPRYWTPLAQCQLRGGNILEACRILGLIEFELERIPFAVDHSVEDFRREMLPHVAIPMDSPLVKSLLEIQIVKVEDAFEKKDALVELIRDAKKMKSMNEVRPVCRMYVSLLRREGVLGEYGRFHEQKLLGGSVLVIGDVKDFTVACEESDLVVVVFVEDESEEEWSPLLRDVSSRFSSVKFLKAGALESLIDRFGVLIYPTYVLLHGDEVIGEILEDPDEDELVEGIEELLAS